MNLKLCNMLTILDTFTDIIEYNIKQTKKILVNSKGYTSSMKAASLSLNSVI